jgi:hypothetical protein
MKFLTFNTYSFSNIPGYVILIYILFAENKMLCYPLRKLLL